MGAICVDVGTSVIKAVGYDRHGAEAAVARSQAAVRRPAPDRAEQDMAEVWDAVARTVREAREALGEPVDFLAVTAQGDGAWLVDAHGDPVGPAALWNDGRAASVVDGWAADGLPARAFRTGGNPTFPGLSHALLTWLKANEPERIDKAAACLTCGGWIFSRLTGQLAVDVSDASAPFLDLRTRRYSPELLALFGMEWAARLLPEPREGAGRVAALTAEAASLLGLPAGTPVVLAPYDIAATAHGVGAIEPGTACGILGTTLCTETPVAEPPLDGDPVGVTLALDDGYLRAFPTLAGVDVLHWACRALGAPGPDALAELASRAEPGADGLVFLPYLSPAGERVPFTDPSARGTLVGLTLHHGPEHLARAVFEGLSLVVRDCLAAIGSPVADLRVCGGGAANAFWTGLIADVTGLPVHRSADREVGARGAHLTGLVATGAHRDLADAARGLVRLRDTFEPAPARYDDVFTRFRALRDGTPPWRRA
ncbi:FGGY-family carbohydrate kinase [Actinocorallia sp. A-T 12471]|uniref:FGGY-family carbohydrate kinase n=1 Tax=Actinocorallia sp. A-T 12471 TaxID=3089813 RepID=UPI0029D2851F|nr:FGGY-family carbohydrate kinase [Actinocorallia sp. A-T 12471]MDX6744205.1 FGGY-family carbohydrate kinase [Actinocorallia sp. A-T 12471]